jgi:hypothetical protein
MAKSRTISLMFLTDENIIDKPDNGSQKDGSDSTTRASLRALMAKTIEVGGRRMPLCALAAPPEVLNKDDQFDVPGGALRDRSGAWVTPDKPWLDVRDANIKSNRARHEQRQQVAKVKQADQLLSMLAGLGAEAEPKPKSKGSDKAPAP